MLRIPCTYKVIRDIASDILTAHDFTPYHCTVCRLKNGGFFFEHGPHHRGKLSLSSNEEVDVSFFSHPWCWYVLSFRKININEFSS